MVHLELSLRCCARVVRSSAQGSDRRLHSDGSQGHSTRRNRPISTYKGAQLLTLTPWENDGTRNPGTATFVIPSRSSRLGRHR